MNPRQRRSLAPGVAAEAGLLSEGARGFEEIIVDGTHYGRRRPARQSGKRRNHDNPPPVTAFKWCVGHSLAASGILDLVLALEALRDEWG